MDVVEGHPVIDPVSASAKVGDHTLPIVLLFILIRKHMTFIGTQSSSVVADSTS